MTPSEFQNWLGDFQARFPSKASWLAGVADPPATIDSWRQLLWDCDLRDCLAVNELIQSGERDFPRDWEQIPAFVRRLSGDLRFISRCREDLPATRSDYLDCELCRSSGVVLCWHPALVRSILSDDYPSPFMLCEIHGVVTWRKWHVGVPCKCDKGARLAHSLRVTKGGDSMRGKNQVKGAEDDEPVERYDSSRYCKVDNPDDPEANVRWWNEMYGDRPEPEADRAEVEFVESAKELFEE